MKLNHIYTGDCLEIMKTFPDKSVDLVITDPPYGIEYSEDKRSRPNESKYENIENDFGELDYKSLIKELQRVGKKLIIFGAENFYKDLPHRGRWICWDKRLTENADKMLGSSFELAWVDTHSGYYKTYRVLHGGVVNADRKELKSRIHPTQKPVELFKKIINDFSQKNDIILDPFLGSGTTAVACKHLKRNYIGIELSQKYVDIANERLKQEMLF